VFELFINSSPNLTYDYESVEHTDRENAFGSSRRRIGRQNIEVCLCAKAKELMFVSTYRYLQ